MQGLLDAGECEQLVQQAAGKMGNSYASVINKGKHAAWPMHNWWRSIDCVCQLVADGSRGKSDWRSSDTAWLPKDGPIVSHLIRTLNERVARVVQLPERTVAGGGDLQVTIYRNPTSSALLALHRT
eukprot:SAG11_NODE_747_length_7366_cov_7.215632_5_plen_126_part_00